MITRWWQGCKSTNSTGTPGSGPVSAAFLLPILWSSLEQPGNLFPRAALSHQADPALPPGGPLLPLLSSALQDPEVPETEANDVAVWGGRHGKAGTAQFQGTWRHCCQPCSGGRAHGSQWLCTVHLHAQLKCPVQGPVWVRDSIPNLHCASMIVSVCVCVFVLDSSWTVQR